MSSLLRDRHVRDGRRTRERILRAALREFAAKGFAGARVDEIARRARVNKRMLYHYFGNKDELFREILRRKIQERAGWAQVAPADPADNLAYWFKLACEDREWIRLLEWEALQGHDDKILNEAERRDAVEQALAHWRERQDLGFLAADLDARHAMLSMMAITTFPVAFPQITRLITGSDPEDAAFREERTRFLRAFARALRPWKPDTAMAVPTNGAAPPGNHP